jgi:lipopolysaccharide transport system ATP-binding protein
MNSSHIAIRAEGLSKVYRLGQRERYSALRDKLARTLRAPWTLLQRTKREEFWALKDVDLEVKQGEVLGLIGRNGAGKTTLLKILSRITRPTKGWAEIYGRVGSLLEVGTGFHPELSGRDNVYLSGAILGMSRQEIRAKFDEIVAFAELEKFLDTQVKHYSSGMYVRLAFAVAAHLEPEILLVDEVLAVGDIKFQKKCLGKMGDVAKEGRTIILVSHQINQIRRLCERVAWVDGGGIRQDGPAHEVISAYETDMMRGERSPEEHRGPGLKAKFISWRLVQAESEGGHALNTHEPVSVSFYLRVVTPIRRGIHGVALYDSNRQIIWGQAAYELELEPGLHNLRYEFPMLPLRPAGYSWMVSIWDEEGLIDMCDLYPDLLVSTESHQHPRDEWSGVLNLPNRFTVSQAETVQELGG